VCAALVGLAPADKPSTFDTKAVSFELHYAGEVSAYRDVSAFVMPEATLALDAIGPPGDYSMRARDGDVLPRGPHSWRWRAPRTPGLYEIEIKGPASKDTIALHAFVMVPASQAKNGFLNGYEIGKYPAKPLNGNPIYLPPSGFVEVTKDNQDTRVSPHFRLKQFLCKEDTTKQYPKYVVLKERLPLKLEAILERVNTLGFHVDTLHIMSAYRTPFYNHAIGDVLFSQHQWGSAADIYIDTDNHDRMDDLNHDGKIDTADSRYLYNVIEQMLTEPADRKFEGGMGYYRGTTAHPPFVHVDVRGTKARWVG